MGIMPIAKVFKFNSFIICPLPTGHLKDLREEDAVEVKENTLTGIILWGQFLLWYVCSCE